MAKDTKIPFHFCRIERAANLIGCEVSDLINLGVLNKISICLLLDGFRSYLIVKGNIASATEWYGNLTTPTSTIKAGKSITEYSRMLLYPYSIDALNENPKPSDLFVSESENDNAFSSSGKAFGLWSLWWGLENIQNSGEHFLSGFELAPCYPKEDNPAMQLWGAGPDDEIEYEDEGEEETEGNKSKIRITVEDLWITAHDVRRLLDFDKDLYLLDEVGHTHDNNERIGEDKVHHSAERHAVNRENVLMAAMRFREENFSLFNESCLKVDGTINYSSWARHVLERPFLFPNSELKIKTEDKVATIISNAYKAPTQRRT